ncbi:MAG: hypothetical protein OXT67_02140, partial [Zetaproteobacteria bacterium]|nr:hypothetical protein [Zetaproteobacteria bacterium]
MRVYILRLTTILSLLHGVLVSFAGSPPDEAFTSAFTLEAPGTPYHHLAELGANLHPGIDW